MHEGTPNAEMTDAEIAEFLTRRGHGVLSFGGDVPYAVPISFGYDADANRCVLQLFSDSESTKRASIEQSDAVTLVTYELESPDDWQSVVVDGQLTALDSEMLEAVDTFADSAAVPSLSVFERSFEELDSEWFELQIDEVSGRQSH